MDSSSCKTQASAIQQVTVLGSTGSIGLSTLDVLAKHRQQFSVFALSANSNVGQLAKQCLQFTPTYAVMADDQAAFKLQQQLERSHCQTQVLSGVQALQEVAEAADVDIVMAAIVGAAGLLPTMAAVHAGKKVLLANKESLVMAGRLFMDAVAASGAQLLPIDSEHNAIFQCLPTHQYDGCSIKAKQDIRKILLTGSGGPLRTWSAEDIRNVSPEQACRHPNWSMGRKISVDSASLMNKGLEFIEAKWLFDADPSIIEVIIHPQSIIHSMVEYMDGSVLAQLGHPDMRTPIAYGLAYPDRIDSGVSSLDIIAAAQLDFEAPDMQRFPALGLSIAAAKQGIGAATTLNAANEMAVDAFLNRHISFGQMIDTLEKIMATTDWQEPEDLESVVDLDMRVRHITTEVIGTLC